jgi:hypothetical protein
VGLGDEGCAATEMTMGELGWTTVRVLARVGDDRGDVEGEVEADDDMLLSWWC